MLYPIELLGQRSATRTGGAKDGVHVNGHAVVCHVVPGLFNRRLPPASAARRVLSNRNVPPGSSCQTFHRAFCIIIKRHHCKVHGPHVRKKAKLLF